MTIQSIAKDQNKMTTNLVHALTDAFALATAALGNKNPVIPKGASEDSALFNIFVTENGVRSLVRNKIPCHLADALVSSANQGASLVSSGRVYEVEQV